MWRLHKRCHFQNRNHCLTLGHVVPCACISADRWTTLLPSAAWCGLRRSESWNVCETAALNHNINNKIISSPIEIMLLTIRNVCSSQYLKEIHAVNSPLACIHGTSWWVSAENLDQSIPIGINLTSWFYYKNLKIQHLSFWIDLIFLCCFKGKWEKCQIYWNNPTETSPCHAWFNRLRGAQKQPACHRRLLSFKITVNHFLTVQESCFHTVRRVWKHFLTCPAMNWPKPGGNVRVETSRVTRAGYTKRLTGRDGLWGH